MSVQRDAITIGLVSLTGPLSADVSSRFCFASDMQRTRQLRAGVPDTFCFFHSTS